MRTQVEKKPQTKQTNKPKQTHREKLESAT